MVTLLNPISHLHHSGKPVTVRGQDATELMKARWWSLVAAVRDPTTEGMSMRNTTPSQYQPPRITELGTVAGLTQGLREGPRLDAAFPDNTPVEDLTFS
jgi:hypothetical protein